MILFWHINRN